MKSTHAGTIQRHLFTVMCVFLIIFSIIACGRGTDKNPTHSGINPTDTADSTSINAVAGALRVEVNKEGLYKITSGEVKKIMPEWENVDPAHFHLTLRGNDQPLWISTQGDNYSIIFFGYPSNSRYAGGNIYMLIWSEEEQLIMPERQMLASSTIPFESFLTTIHLEENNKYTPQVTEGDHLFWLSLTGRQQQEFEVNLPKLSNGDGQLRIHVWGNTSSPEAYDHHLVVSLNGQILMDEKWDGAGRRTLEAVIPDGLMANRKNVVLIDVPGDTGAAAEINYVDWIEVRYPRQTEADQDSLAFDYSQEIAGSPLRIYGFSDSPVVVDITVPTNTVRIAGGIGKNELLFVGETGHRYLAVGSRGFSNPVGITQAVFSPDLRVSGTGADYVAVGPQDLLQPLTPLLDWRASQGLKVVSVPLEALYDQFNAGMPEPEAIRAFLAYTVKNWQPAPRYLLLVGDATYDPRGFISTPEANRLPVIFVQTSFGGETASDVLYGDLDGDQLPDIAVGRIPAQDANQVRIIVEKILNYEQSSTVEVWHKRVLAIADGQEASFKGDAQMFLGRVTTPLQGTLYAPEAGVKDAPEKVKDYFNEGYGVIAYFGHGSINMWGKDRIFSADDVNNLSNREHLPVIINMTCLTGLFIHPKVTSITETLLWYDNGGVVAMLAPTSLTLPGSQSFLSQALVDSLIQKPDTTLGENYLQAQQKIPKNDPGAHEVLLTFLLFGDPGLKLNLK